MPTRKYFIHGALSGVANVAGSAISVVIALPILVRELGLADYGAWAALGFFVNLAIAFDLGVGRAIVYLVSREGRNLADLVCAGVAICGVIAVILVLALTILLTTGNMQFVPGASNFDVWLTMSGCIVVISSLLASVLRGALEARMQISLVHWGFLLQTVLVYLSAVVGALMGLDVHVILLITASIYLLMLLFHAFAVRALAHAKGGELRSRTVSVLLSHAVRMFIIGAPTLLLIPTLQYLFLRTTGDVAQYGLFDLAHRIAMMGAAAVASIATPLYSVVASMNHADKEVLAGYIGRHLLVTIAVFLIGLLTFVALGERLMAFVFGAEHTAVFQAALYLIVGLGAMAAVEPITRAFMGLGRLRVLLWVRVLIVAGTVLMLSVTATAPAVERYASSYAIGCVIGAVATVVLLLRWRGSFRLFRWRSASAVIGNRAGAPTSATDASA